MRNHISKITILALCAIVLILGKGTSFAYNLSGAKSPQMYVYTGYEYAGVKYVANSNEAPDNKICAYDSQGHLLGSEPAPGNTGDVKFNPKTRGMYTFTFVNKSGAVLATETYLVDWRDFPHASP